MAAAGSDGSGGEWRRRGMAAAAAAAASVTHDRPRRRRRTRLADGAPDVRIRQAPAASEEGARPTQNAALATGTNAPSLPDKGRRTGQAERSAPAGTNAPLSPGECVELSERIALHRPERTRHPRQWKVVDGRAERVAPVRERPPEASNPPSRTCRARRRGRAPVPASAPPPQRHASPGRAGRQRDARRSLTTVPHPQHLDGRFT